MQKTQLNIRTSYQRYCKEVEKETNMKDFVSIANGYMEFLMNKVLEGEEVTLPARLGTLYIQGVKKKLTFSKEGNPRLPPNWAATKRLWDSDPAAKLKKQIVYCTNEESDGVVYKINWSKNRVPIENKLLYALRITRANKRAIHNQIKAKKEYLIKTE